MEVIWKYIRMGKEVRQLDIGHNKGRRPLYLLRPNFARSFYFPDVGQLFFKEMVTSTDISCL